MSALSSYNGRNKVELLDKSDRINEVLNSDPTTTQIFGMTCWAAYKNFYNDETKLMKPAFDVIVMDEASQIRSMDAMIALECADFSSPRFLLVGDNNQLPPIISGKYKQDSNQDKMKKYIYGSIFRMYETALKDENILSVHPGVDKNVMQLNDNYRMNGILCKYPAMSIYGKDYKSSSVAIRNQKISLRSNPDDEFLSFVLDEQYPLVYCELSGDQTDQTKTEIMQVTQIVKELKNNLLNSDDTLASDHDNFWNDTTNYPGACGVICPHHEHIARLKSSVRNECEFEDNNLYIGTVDKLQGQERTVVIVSYGISEKEKIKNEMEFIFSKNRFNVSITRGKAKTIIFLSDSITNFNVPSNNESVKEGQKFIQGFKDYIVKEVNEIKGPDDASSEKSNEKVENRSFVINNVTITVWRKKLL